MVVNTSEAIPTKSIAITKMPFLIILPKIFSVFKLSFKTKTQTVEGGPCRFEAAQFQKESSGKKLGKHQSS